jgi:cyanate permease
MTVPNVDRINRALPLLAAGLFALAVLTDRRQAGPKVTVMAVLPGVEAGCIVRCGTARSTM